MTSQHPEVQPPASNETQKDTSGSESQPGPSDASHQGDKDTSSEGETTPAPDTTPHPAPAEVVDPLNDPTQTTSTGGQTGPAVQEQGNDDKSSAGPAQTPNQDREDPGQSGSSSQHKRGAAWSGAQDHLANPSVVGRTASSANTAVCGTFNSGRGDKIVPSAHHGPEMCPNCLNHPSARAGWPGV